MKPKEFKYRHFLPEIILHCLRWYLRYPLGYRQLSEMISERGIRVDHTTIYRWVQHYAPEFEKRICWYARPSAWSLRVDETYIKVRGQWKYLYRAVDKYGRTVDFMLAHSRDLGAAKRFFKKILKQCKQMPSSITTDKHCSYHTAIEELKRDGYMGATLFKELGSQKNFIKTFQKAASRCDLNRQAHSYSQCAALR